MGGLRFSLLYALLVTSTLWLGLAVALDEYDVQKLIFFRVGDIQYFNIFLEYKKSDFVYVLPNLAFALPLFIVKIFGEYGFFISDMVIIFCILHGSALIGNAYNINKQFLSVFLFLLLSLSVVPPLWVIPAGIVDYRVTYPYVTTGLFTLLIGFWVKNRPLEFSDGGRRFTADDLFKILVVAVFFNVYQFTAVILLGIFFIYYISTNQMRPLLILLMGSLCGYLAFKILTTYFDEFKELYGIYNAPLGFRIEIMKAYITAINEYITNEGKFLLLVLVLSSLPMVISCSYRSILLFIGVSFFWCLFAPGLMVLLSAEVGQVNRLLPMAISGVKALIIINTIYFWKFLVSYNFNFRQVSEYLIKAGLFLYVGGSMAAGYVWGHYLAIPRPDAFLTEHRESFNAELISILDRIDTLEVGTLVVSDDPVVGYYAATNGFDILPQDVISVDDRECMLSRFKNVIDSFSLNKSTESTVTEFFTRKDSHLYGNYIWFFAHNKYNKMKDSVTQMTYDTSNVDFLDSWVLNPSSIEIDERKDCSGAKNMVHFMVARGSVFKDMILENNNCRDDAPYKNFLICLM